MNNKYPYLRKWKQLKEDKKWPLPVIPREVRLKTIAKAIGIPYKNTILTKLILEKNLRHRQRLYNAVQGWKKNKITNKYLRGEITKEEAKSELAAWALPLSRGMYGFRNKDIWKILKHCYIEMVASIKEIRKSLDVSLINKDFYSEASMIKTEDVRELTPWALNIFEENEISLLFKEPSASDTAYFIIRKRIRGHLRNSLELSYFKKKLKNTRP